MLQTVYSAGLNGVDGFPVTIECNCANRLAKFEVVGLPDAAVREARERIKAAIENSGFEFPEADITVNMAPADRKKQGSAYDLALLIGILGCCGNLKLPDDISDTCFIGELSLSGEVRGVHGVLCMCLSARAAGKKKIFVPAENAGEASVTDGVEVYSVSHVRELIDHLRGVKSLSPAVFDMRLFEEGINSFELDFSDVKGQDRAKRALEIAAAGGHNILLIGPPGTGKSMLAKRLPSILPPLGFEEAIETTKLHSVAGILPDKVSLLTARPFRSPHHTASATAMAGGGKIPVPGEASMANNGVLFLDELPEFSRNVTEVLRQPLEDGAITVTRTACRVTYPSSFMLVCAMNPCKCGYFGHPTKECTCNPKDIKKYISKISGPLLDRIDIQIEVPSLEYSDLSKKSKEECSLDIRARVNKAREIMQARFVGETRENGKAIACNAQMESKHIRKYCELSKECSDILEKAFNALGLSARGHDRILRLARTIADLDNSEQITPSHILEAIQLRTLEKKYF